MLNRAKVLFELQKFNEDLFQDISHELSIAQKTWHIICQDPLFQARCFQTTSPWSLPKWQGSLQATYCYDRFQEPHRVVGIDGSQIYPDRHQGTSCYLINIGMIIFNYNTLEKPVSFINQPFVFLPVQEQDIMDFVNHKRQELEFFCATQCSEKISQHMYPTLILFDCSLIFWHLENKTNTIKELYIKSYITLLEQLYEQKILTAWYISAPKNKDLINLLRMQLANFAPHQNNSFAAIEPLVDLHVLSFFLQQYHRSTVFEHQAAIIHYYPEHLRPYFYYMHTGQEYARIEIPAWIAADQKNIDIISRIILDQTHKGLGYPICLAEAHEQAIVKGPDRDFFYHCLQKISIEQKKKIQCSLKSIKKRGMSV